MNNNKNTVRGVAVFQGYVYGESRVLWKVHPPIKGMGYALTPIGSVDRAAFSDRPVAAHDGFALYPCDENGVGDISSAAWISNPLISRQNGYVPILPEP